MDSILKLAAVAVTAALCTTVIRKTAPEVSMVLALAAGALILASSLQAMNAVVDVMEELSDKAGISTALLAPVLKTTGIAVMTKIAGEVCRDAKEGGLAAFLDIAGSAAALLTALPLLKTVLSMITELL